MPNDGVAYSDVGSKTDIFRNYFLYVSETEPPIQYHRWCWLSSISAIIGRNAYTEHGHFHIYPNLYLMLLGEPAARKSTSIKMAKKLVTASGFDKLASDKTTKEKFLSDLAGIEDDLLLGENTKGKPKYDAITAENLWGPDGGDNKEPREVFIVADEFNEFAGPGNLDFYTTLGNLWDWDDPNQHFSQRFKNSKSISIYQPTISILSGNTPELFARCFPPEAIGSGFLSRILLIHGERSGRKITWPPPPDKELGARLVSYLMKLRAYMPGCLTKSPAAMDLIDRIYQEDDGVIDDIRFKAYSNRRMTQLLKLCVILATARFQKEITDTDVIEANTILSHAEILMPKAMGEFGKSKNSDVANKIVAYLDTVLKPASVVEIWKQVNRDLPAMKDLVDILTGLVAADKLQVVTGVRSGYLPKRKPGKSRKFVDWSLLTEEERDMI